MNQRKYRGVVDGQTRLGVQEIQQINPYQNSKFWEKQRGKSWTYGEAKSRLDGGKHLSKCKWLNLSILANLCLL